VRKAHQSEVLIYASALNDESRAKPRRKRALKELATASGGLEYYPKTLSEIEIITPQIGMKFAISTSWRTPR